MNFHDKYNGPRIGLYYGIVIDQDRLIKKIQPIDVASIVEKLTGISPFDPKASWKLDYDHSQCSSTIVVYHIDYTKIASCPGYIGGWSPNGFTKMIPSDISNVADIISSAVEKYLQPNITEISYAIIANGYCVIYFVE